MELSVGELSLEAFPLTPGESLTLTPTFTSNSSSLLVPLTSSVMNTPSTTLCTPPTTPSSFTPSRKSSKKCLWCEKTARGGSNLCARHGGGKRCFCGKIARGSSGTCGSHGGGRRCASLGCTKGAAGATSFCLAHGGGKRCEVEGCIRAAHGRSDRCFKHNGARPCEVEGCTKGAVGKTERCIAHGGGRRCGYPECAKGAAAGGYCVKHGGGRRCAVEGCGRVAQTGASVCLSHGGGKKCATLGCGRAVGVSHSLCVAHRGICSEELCGRPRASEVTDKCVLHGGAAVGIPLCVIEGCDEPANKGMELCRMHAPRRSRKSVDTDTLGNITSLLDVKSLFGEMGFGISGTDTVDEITDFANAEFVIDLGDQAKTDRVTSEKAEVEAQTQQLLSLLAHQHATLAD